MIRARSQVQATTTAANPGPGLQLGGQRDEVLDQPPGRGRGMSLGIIAATFPLLARITGPEVARNE